MQEIPPYLKYGYFRRKVEEPDSGISRLHDLGSARRDAQLADLCVLAYAERDFIVRTLRDSPCSPYTLLDVVKEGEVQAIVAVDHQPYAGQRVVAFRGTRTFSVKDWLIDFDCRIDEQGCHEGFRDAFMPLLPKISELVNKNPVIFTGHSLGGALATVAFREVFPVTDGASLVTFGSPKVGNEAFAGSIYFKFDRARRYVHGEDMVPSVPTKAMGFEHVSPSCYLRQMPRPWINFLAPRHVFDHIPTLYAERLWETV